MIRSLTIGIPVSTKSQSYIEASCKRILQVSEDVLREANFAPRTIRYTLPPVGLEGETEGLILSIIKFVDGLATATNVRWFCLPYNFIADGSRRERLSVALDIVSRSPKMFLNMIVADTERLSLCAINDAATLISQISKRSNNGFDNFRVGVSCGCPSNAPFFPFSHHKGDSMAFSFALETTGIALAVANEFGVNPNIDTYRDSLVDRLAPVLCDIQQLGKWIEQLWL